jgi:hypothetical protein
VVQWEEIWKGEGLNRSTTRRRFVQLKSNSVVRVLGEGKKELLSESDTARIRGCIIKVNERDDQAGPSILAAVS